MKRRRNPSPAGRVRPKTFTARIPGVNISISLRPTAKGVKIVSPRVSYVKISRGAMTNPRGKRHRKNPLPALMTPGRPGIVRPGTTVVRQWR